MPPARPRYRFPVTHPRHHDAPGNDRPDRDPGSADPLLPRRRPPRRHEFERLFATHATLDYTAFGGPVGSRSEIAAYLEQVTSAMRGTRHTISTSLLIVDGDAATARTAGQAMMISADDAGRNRMCFVGLWYRDLLVRTECGWRIRSRTQERSWLHDARPAATAWTPRAAASYFTSSASTESGSRTYRRRPRRARARRPLAPA
ncbi:TPA: nuclear transport factor 2 family protein [Burkholderia aenigmatica]|uniref:nuclear transport factor 2 family protein n=1 Tax=Burkholderia sp. AU45251 TaxID=3059204 RepID=UPI0029965840|nr:nuclear transport factor 2 family protein [Burkholderia aenigmatica]HDR9515527.1 nuclear transport factor 2 family protein [Burkholderia aenigmatica]HDR9590431.1 nuclear transport factor 2 family protein [Burkholderia aenigmatica]HDR9598804.1 nuclear transport factor 2 family protein [Burkholderia aenigmatica]HDR9606916.1 nuclear transport factor 2 family protein [Burkholderia aenigmatica]